MLPSTMEMFKTTLGNITSIHDKLEDLEREEEAESMDLQDTFQGLSEEEKAKARKLLDDNGLGYHYVGE